MCSSFLEGRGTAFRAAKCFQTRAGSRSQTGSLTIGFRHEVASNGTVYVSLITPARNNRTSGEVRYTSLSAPTMCSSAREHRRNSGANGSRLVSLNASRHHCGVLPLGSLLNHPSAGAKDPRAFIRHDRRPSHLVHSGVSVVEGSTKLLSVRTNPPFKVSVSVPGHDFGRR